jgi:hypothetical protein
VELCRRLRRRRPGSLSAYDTIIGLDFSEVAIDGSMHKSPGGGDGTGENPTDRAKLGWKWSVMTDKAGIPIGWTATGANRNDCILLAPALAGVVTEGLVHDVETIWLDRGYNNVVRSTSPISASPTLSSPSAVGRVRRPPPSRCPWAFVGPSSGPTRGCPTSANSDATRTERPCTWPDPLRLAHLTWSPFVSPTDLVPVC